MSIRRAFLYGVGITLIFELLLTFVSWEIPTLKEAVGLALSSLVVSVVVLRHYGKQLSEEEDEQERTKDESSESSDCTFGV